MYAIFLNNNKQYIINKKNYIKVDFIKSNIGNIIKINKIVYLENENTINLGNPYIENKELIFEIIKHYKEKKMTILKFKRRKNYAKKIGHRQKYTILKLLSLNNKED